MTAMLDYEVLDWQPEEVAMLEPRRRLGIVEWAAGYRVLDRKTSSIAGPWNWAHSYALIEPACALTDYRIHEVTMQGPTQFGKTDLKNNFLGQTVAEDPCPFMIVLPTEQDAKDRVRSRIKPMFASCEGLQARGVDPDQINTGEMTDLGAMFLYLGWASADRTLSDRPVCRAAADEVRYFAPGALEEIRQRFGTFSFWTFLKTSTPSDQNGEITKEYDRGDGRRLYLRCGHCGEFHVPDWRSNVQIDKAAAGKDGKDGRFFTPDAYRDGRKSRYVCTHCGVIWRDDGERYGAVAAGLWVPRGCRPMAARPRKRALAANETARPALSPKGMLAHVLAGHDYEDVSSAQAEAWIVGPSDAFDRPHRSYQLGNLHLDPRLSKFAKRTVMVSMFVGATAALEDGDVEPLKTFVTEWLGEHWEEKSISTREEVVATHGGVYDRGEIPIGDEATALILTVDVQRAGFIWHVWAWRYGYEGFLVDHDTYETGPTDDLVKWDRIRDLLPRSWPSWGEGGRQINLSWALIDSGDGERTAIVYRFCRRCGFANVVPTKGDSYVSPSSYWRVRKIETDPGTGKQVPAGQLLYEFNPDAYKTRLATMLLKKPASDGSRQSGYVHLPRDPSKELLRQICSEQRVAVRKKRGGKVQDVYVWQLRRGYRANHDWDCAVLGLLGADLARVGGFENPADRRSVAAPTPPPAAGKDGWVPDVGDHWI